MRIFIKDNRGQANAEYGLILALIAVIVVLVINNSRFRCTIKSMYINVVFHLYMAGTEVDAGDQLFQQFMIENNWDSTRYDYNDGIIKCSDIPYIDKPVPVPWLD